MSAPRTKRPFAGAASDPAQRQITSFFGSKNPAAAPGTVAAAPSPSSSPAAQPPVLPASVQTNLLNVGMRVRKSVPEGYKTGSDFGGFALWSELSSPRGGSGAADTTVHIAAPQAPTRRELLPFCGIHNVGGMASQPETDDSFAAPHIGEAFVLGVDDVPSLISSQETVSSTTSVPGPGAGTAARAPSRKRFYTDDDDEDDGGEEGGDSLRVWHDEWNDGDVSPRSLAPVGWENARVMAVPRTSKRKSGLAGPANPEETAAGGRAEAGTLQVPLKHLGQENMAVDNDFGEAEFLAYRPDMEMSGI